MGRGKRQLVMLVALGAVILGLLGVGVTPAEAASSVAYSPVLNVHRLVSIDFKLQTKASVSYDNAGHEIYYGVGYRIQDCSFCWSGAIVGPSSDPHIARAWIDVYLYRNGVATYTSTHCDVTADANEPVVNGVPEPYHTKTWTCPGPPAPRTAGASYFTSVTMYLVFGDGTKYTSAVVSPTIRVP